MSKRGLSSSAFGAPDFFCWVFIIVPVGPRADFVLSMRYRQSVHSVEDISVGHVRIGQCKQSRPYNFLTGRLRQRSAHGLEGIIAKDRDRSYRSGRFGDWVKVKCLQSNSFMIVGYEHSMSACGGIGSLTLAARKGD
jgi:hypothetical protein